MPSWCLVGAFSGAFSVRAWCLVGVVGAFPMPSWCLVGALLVPFPCLNGALLENMSKDAQTKPKTPLPEKNIN